MLLKPKFDQLVDQIEKNTEARMNSFENKNETPACSICTGCKKLRKTMGEGC